MYSNKNFYIYYNFVILHFNYLPFTYSYSQGYYNFLSGQDSSEVKSYILRKKKCMLMFYCAPISICQHGAWVCLDLLELFLNTLV